MSEREKEREANVKRERCCSFIMLKIIYFSIGFVTYEFCYEKYVTLSSSFFAQDRIQTRSYPPALFWLGCVLIFDRAISFSVCVCVKTFGLISTRTNGFHPIKGVELGSKGE